MDAGTELDALIVGRVMGWKIFAGEPGYGRRPDKPISLILDPIPHYSTDIAAAWLVVERLKAFAPVIEYYPDGSGAVSNQWRALFTRLPDGQRMVLADADTAPLAICLAALQAVGAPS